jgi:hypothetical protein
MDLETQLRNVCSSLHENHLTVSSFIHSLLDMHPHLSQSEAHTRHVLAQENLLFSAADICAELYRYDSEHIFSWVLEAVQMKLCKEVITLAEENSGLHFKASTASSNYLEGSFMQVMTGKIQSKAPHLWLLISGLLDANPLQCHVSAPAAQMGVPDASDSEGDLGEIGGIGIDVDSEGDEDESVPESVRKAKKRRICAITQNAALVSIVSISIIVTNTFNPLYSIRSLLSASAFFYRAQMRGAITFRAFLAYLFTRHQFLKRLSRHLPTLVYQSASH